MKTNNPGQRIIESALTEEDSVISARALVLANCGRQCLILQRSAFHKSNIGLWELPGGKVDPAEKAKGIQGIIDAMLREVKEESGLETTYENGLWIIESHPRLRTAGARLVVGGIVSIAGGSVHDFDVETQADPDLLPEHSAARWHNFSIDPLTNDMTTDTTRFITAFNHQTTLPCVPIHRRELGSISL